MKLTLRELKFVATHEKGEVSALLKRPEGTTHLLVPQSKGNFRNQTMCRNIKTLYNFDPPANSDEVQASAIQFVRKL